MKKLLMLFLVVIMLTPAVNVQAATKVAKPTYTATINEKGDVTVTLKHSNPKAKLYYSINKSITAKSKYVTSGKSISTNYNDAVYIYVKAKVGTVYSEYIKVNVGTLSLKKYTTMYKKVVDTVTKGKITEEDKLVAIWDWIMMNTQYSYKPGTLKIDLNYADNQSLMFDGKSTCVGFAWLWKDMTTYAGFDTQFVSVPEYDHAVNVTKVNGKWFYVDATHDYKMTTVTYDRFLDNSVKGFSKKWKGYDISSNRYELDEFTGTWYNSIFKYKASFPGDTSGTITYDKVSDKYSFIWNEDTEE